jgi:hypothetical protein
MGELKARSDVAISEVRARETFLSSLAELDLGLKGGNIGGRFAVQSTR